MRLVRDPLARFNERVRLLSGFINAIALGLIGFAVLRPLADPDAAARGMSATWGLTGLALHGLAHYILGRLSKEVSE